MFEDEVMNFLRKRIQLRLSPHCAYRKLRICHEAYVFECDLKRGARDIRMLCSYAVGGGRIYILRGMCHNLPLTQ